MAKKIIAGIGLLGLITLSLLIYHFVAKPKVAYIDVPKVFNGFEMKTEMQHKYKNTETIRKKIADSLSFDLQMLSRKLQENKNDKDLAYLFDLKRQEFFKKKKEMEEDNMVLSNQYDKQILEQMSQYVLDYGKKNNYDFIYGSDGNGTLMYAGDQYNLSEEIISYINNRYKGIE